MNFKEIDFTEKTSQRIYESYIKRIKKVSRALNQNDREEILLEINSHIHEGLIRNAATSETERLLDVLERLGDPEETLRPLVADKKMDQATKSFNPIHIAKALVLNLTNGISYLLFFLLYLSLFSFVFLIGAKIFNPETVGIFYQGSEFLVLGKTSINNLTDPSTTEVLGGFFIPVMLIAIIVFYILITLLLKFKRSINKK